MARNEEKAQSMLYRFREAQAAELGLGTRSDRRPRMASACKSLRDCERWRGEILREISRKVSKIQDAGLTDYEVRDLNDEINKLMREKRHWENQIIALGGANYRRNVAMLDDDGKEVPGTKGYKYFGRAKELPGVRELFQSRAKEEDEENRAKAFYQKFTNQGPTYFGDLDEKDGSLLQYEKEAEEAEWEDAYSHLRKTLSMTADDSTPKMPRRELGSTATTTTTGPHPPADAKRKAPDEDVDMASADDPLADSAKHSNADGTTDSAVTAPNAVPADIMQQSAKAVAAFIPFLSADELLPPKLPTRDDMEAVLLALRKKALLADYFGE